MNMASENPPPPQKPDDLSGEDAARTRHAKVAVEEYIRGLRKIIQIFRKLFN
jgi:hypothetical protein